MSPDIRRPNVRSNACGIPVMGRATEEAAAAWRRQRCLAPAPAISVYGRMTNAGGERIQLRPTDLGAPPRAGAGAGTDLDLDQVLEEVPRDHDALDLARALADLADLRVAHHTLNREVPGVTVTTMELHRRDRRAHREL
jgi:hypothetical protein